MVGLIVIARKQMVSPSRSPRSRAVSRKRECSRRGAALLLALLVMTLASTLVVATMDAQTMRYAALRNTQQWDEARYVAEAGLNDAFAHLEKDIQWRAGISSTEFPTGSGNRYSAVVTDAADGAVSVIATGSAGGFTRRIQATVKHGG